MSKPKLEARLNALEAIMSLFLRRLRKADKLSEDDINAFFADVENHSRSMAPASRTAATEFLYALMPEKGTHSPPDGRGRSGPVPRRAAAR